MKARYIKEVYTNEKCLLEMRDQNHNILEDSNKGSLVGSRIKTEMI